MFASLRFALPLLVLAGCVSSTSHEPPKKTFYVLNALPAAAEQQAVSSPYAKDNVLIAKTRTTTLSDTKMLTAKLPDNQIRNYTLHEYYAPPALQVPELLAEALRRANAFGAVMTQLPQSDIKWRIETVLEELCGDYRNPDKPLAVASVRLYLVDAQKNGFAPIHQELLRAEVPLNDKRPATLAEGLNTALWQALTSFNPKAL